MKNEMQQLYETIVSRKSDAQEGSYTAYLFEKGNEKIRFGIYACSPEDSSFKAAFSDMKLTECQWKAHDGQQPDE